MNPETDKILQEIARAFMRYVDEDPATPASLVVHLGDVQLELVYRADTRGQRSPVTIHTVSRTARATPL